MSAAIVAFALYPEVQRRAQAEIDSAIGRDRLPDFNDRVSLPYIEAIRREVIRWHVITPLGAGRATICDDIYDGYVIPKGDFTSVFLK